MRAIRGSAFRMAVLYSVLFVVSASILLSVALWWATRAIIREVDAIIDSDVARLTVEYETAGMRGLTDEIRQRIGGRPALGDALYLVIDRQGQPVVGNLSAWPRTAPDSAGRITFMLGQMQNLDDTARRGRARVVRLRGDVGMVVGRDLVYLDLLRARMLGGLGWGILVTFALAVLGGAAISASANRRIATLNAALDDVMGGELARRLPMRGNDDEIDALIGHVNGMLDRITELMTNVRQVSDNIAHDLRTPLTRLRRRLEEVAGSEELPSGQRAAIETAAAEADGLLATFNALLRIARIESADRRKQFEDLDLRMVVEDVVELYEPLAEEADKRLVHDTMPARAEVRGDRDMLFQALANLVDNALKYTPAGGQVRVSAEITEEAAELVVQDDGPGIPESDRKRVLRRFVRLDESRSTAGNGLGLALVDAVARLHGGEVLIEDAEPGTRVRARIRRR